MPPRNFTRLTGLKYVTVTCLLNLLVLVMGQCPAWCEPSGGAVIGLGNGLPGEPVVRAKAAVLMDATTGELLWAKNPQNKLAPASLTKMTTAILALEHGEPDWEVQVSRRAAGTEVGSDMGLRPGDRLRLADLVAAGLIASANDGAVALGEFIGGTEPFFLAMMHRKARLSGAVHTSFKNTNGYSRPGHFSTAMDMALIARYCMANPSFAAIVTQLSGEVVWLNRDRQWQFDNTNKLLKIYPGADGIKTGTAVTAGKCLAASATVAERRLIAIVLNSSNRWGDAAALLDFGFSALHRLSLPADRPYTRVEVRGGRQSLVAVVPAESFFHTIPAAERELVEYQEDLPRWIRAPVRAGQVLGSVRVFYRGKELGTVQLVAKEAVLRQGCGFW